jgi:hypothetical protein
MNTGYRAFVQVIYPEQELGTYHKAYTYGIPFGAPVPACGDLVSVDAAGCQKVAQVVKVNVRRPGFRVKPATVVTPYCPGGYVDPTFGPVEYRGYGRTIRMGAATEAAMARATMERFIEAEVAREVKRQLSDLRITAARRD